MSKKHEFDDGTVVYLDDGVEVEDFLHADADQGITEEEFPELVAKCEAEVDTSDLDDDYEPEPEDKGGDLA